MLIAALLINCQAARPVVYVYQLEFQSIFLFYVFGVKRVLIKILPHANAAACVLKSLKRLEPHRFGLYT